MFGNILNGEGWHLDKRVPLALIVAIALQTAGALWWAAASTERLSQLEKIAQSRAGISERTARLEEQLIYVRGSLGRIEQKIDNLGKTD